MKTKLEKLLDEWNEKPNPLCSFCGKGEEQHGVRWVIAGPGVFICDECVWLCADILNEEGIERPVAEEDHEPA